MAAGPSLIVGGVRCWGMGCGLTGSACSVLAAVALTLGGDLIRLALWCL